MRERRKDREKGMEEKKGEKLMNEGGEEENELSMEEKGRKEEGRENKGERKEQR